MSDYNHEFDFTVQVWKILLVDDDASHRQYLMNGLRDYPAQLEFTEISTAQEAIAALAGNRYDIAFMDVNLPGMSGLAALETARTMGSRTFVTIVSEDQPDNCAEIGRQLGAYDYLRKPVSQYILYSILDCYAEIRREKSVLIIDDSRSARSAMRRILENSVFALKVDEAESAVEGFERFVTAKSDVVMLDINMKEMRGDTALRIFRAAFPAVHVVLMSSDMEALGRSACQHRLKKPFGRFDIDNLLYTFSGLRQPFSTLRQT